MPAILIDGRAHAAALLASAREAAAALLARTGVRPGLAVVLVGDDSASAVYVRSKARRAAEAGIASFEHRLPAATSQADLLALLARLNADPAVHGILVQLPLPKPLDPAEILDSLDPAKDVDGFHVTNVGKLALGLPGLVPCTPLGCLHLLRATHPEGLAGKHAVVLGRSAIVGRPVAQLLLQADCTVTVAHSRTTDLPALCREADILVAAVGRPGFVRGDWIRPGASVIDVGINRVGDRLVGDVAFEEAVAVAGHLTPVPGGVGPMTIACLLLNTLRAARHLLGLPPAEDPA